MDELDKRLQEDAERIEASVSPELSRRIEASLEFARPERPSQRIDHPWLLWGGALALAASVVLLMQLRGDVTKRDSSTANRSRVSVPALLRGAEAVTDLSGPLEQELDNLRADFRVAERSLGEQIGL